MSTTKFAMQRPEGLEDWKSEVPEHVVERAKKALEDNYSQFVGTANFIGVGLTDEHIYRVVRGSCHSRMTDPSKDKRVVLATENATTRRVAYYKKNETYRKAYGEFTPELVRPFLKWFLYDSPYGFIILNRDDFDSCEKLGFVLAGDAPTTLVQSACIVSRHFWECMPASFREFNKLVERGIDGFIAYQICFNSTISTYTSAGELSRNLFGYVNNHRVSAAVNPEQMLNYYRGKVQNSLGGTYQERPSIYGSSKLFVYGYSEQNLIPWTLSNYRQRSPEFHKYMLETEGKLDKSGIYRPPNPFVQKTNAISEHAFTCEQAVSGVADYCQQYIEKELATNE